MAATAKVTSGTTGTIRAIDATTNTILASETFTDSSQLRIKFIYFDAPSVVGHDLRMELAIDTGSNGDKMYVTQVMGGQLWEQMVHEANISNPLLKFVNAVYNDPSLHAQYLTYADMFRNFIAENFVHKWDPYWKQLTGSDGNNNGTGVYTIPNGLSTEWFPGRTLAHNQYLSYSRMLYLLHDATATAPAFAADRPLYLSRANDMNRAFKSTIRAHPLNAELGTDAYLWDYWNIMGEWDLGHYLTVYPNEDTSHASLTAASLLEAYRHGQVYDESDMLKFTRTLTDVMWNQSLTAPLISASNHQLPTTGPSVSYHFWANYAQFDQTVTDISSAICELLTCNPYIASFMAKWSRNKAVNTSFEDRDPLDATLPAHWQRYQSVSETVYRSSAADTGLGQWAVTIAGNGFSDQGLEQQLTAYEPNTTYSVHLKGKAAAGVSVTADVYDYTDSVQLGSVQFSDSVWSSHVFTAATPLAADHDIRVRVYTDGAAIFDDVQTYPYLNGSHLPNGSFESAQPSDATLPLYWKRGLQTIGGNVEVVTTEHASGLRSVHLATATGGAPQELVYQWKGYRPGKDHTFTVAAKTNGSASGGRVQVIDTTTSTVLASLVLSGTSWSTYSIDFTAPLARDHELTVVISHDNSAISGGSLWVDDIAALVKE
jgi:hypothetical protein